jgi:hypothetical protein
MGACQYVAISPTSSVSRIINHTQERYMTKPVRLGAVDWRSPSWTGAFYPSDMPEEWRLAYYSSQFNCVFIDAGTWRRASPSELSQWCDDVHSQFVFLLEGDEVSTPPEALGHKALMMNKADSRIVWFDGKSDLKQLSRAVLSEGDESNLYLISRDGDLGQMERVNTMLELMGL